MIFGRHISWRILCDIFSLLCFVLSFGPLIGQVGEASFIRFGKEDGLPSNHIYGLTQDSEGFLWISTENGVSRYNGYEFENFDISDGLTDNEVFGTHEDSKGRLWMRTFSGLACYYQEGKFYNPSNMPFLAKMAPSGFLSSFLEDSLGNIYLGCRDGSIYKIDSNNDVTDLGCRERRKCRNWGLFTSSRGIIGLGDYKIIIRISPFPRERIRIVTSNNDNSSWWPLRLARRKNGGSIIAGGKNAIFLDQDLKANELTGIIQKGKILEVSESEDETVYFGTTNGLYHFSKSDFDFPIEPIILESKQCLAVLDKGKEGRWIGTSNGLYYQPTTIGLEIAINENFGKVTSIQKSKKAILLGTEHGNLVEVNTLNYDDRDIQVISESRIKSIYKINSKEEWLRSETGLYQRKNGEVLLSLGYVPRDLEILSNDSVCVCVSSNWKIAPITSIWNKNFESDPDFLARTFVNEIQCFEIHYSTDSTLWIYDALGIHTYKKGAIEDDSLVTKLLGNSKAIKIESSNGNVFFATNGNGLIVRRGKQVFKVTKKSGLLDNKIKDIYPDPVNGLWVAYARGIQRLSWSGFTGLEIMNLPQGTIPSKGVDILQVISDSTHLFVLTEASVFQVEKPSGESNYEGLTTRINNVTLNDTASLDSSQNDFAHYENSFQFDFIAISFRAMGNVQYRYRLNGLEKKWSSTKARFAKYPSIPPGTYEFEVQAKVIGEEWGESTFFRTIRVLPPYWQTWWFRLAITLGIVLIAVIVLLLILRSNRRRNLLIQQTMLAKHKALITQMNPHFIFNSLNSIQRFFITNDLESANDYLVDFGNLIRIILENGRETNITLEKEVTLLDLYMKMEALRMRQKFDFEITHDGLDLAQVVIPPMLLQPFVENAIWHGVAGLKGHGHISINFHQVDDRLCVEIEDNGVGRPTKKVVKKGKSSVHQSLATRITKERIDLMKSDHPDQVLFKIVDLKDENKRPRGTLVMIQMPFETQEVIGGLKNESNTNR